MGRQMTEQDVSKVLAQLSYDPETGIFHHRKNAGCMLAGQRAGNKDSSGHIQFCVDRKMYLAHRVAFLFVEGKMPPDDMEVDHINGIRHDNRWCNLRLATRQQNSWNRACHKNSKSGLRGVRFAKRRGKWEALIYLNKRQKHIGYYSTAEEASQAFAEAVKKYRGPEWAGRDLHPAPSHT